MFSAHDPWLGFRFFQDALSAQLDPATGLKKIRLPREVPSPPVDPPLGRAFHPRSPRGVKRCSAEAPPVLDLSPTHRVCCWLCERPNPKTSAAACCGLQNFCCDRLFLEFWPVEGCPNPDSVGYHLDTDSYA